MRLIYLFVVLFFCLSPEATVAVKIEKALLYTGYQLQDRYAYGDKTREFQWQKISDGLDSALAFQRHNIWMGILVNYKNVNGVPPLAKEARKNRYKGMDDAWGTSQYQGIPFYKTTDITVPERYGRDGMLVALVNDSAGYFKIRTAFFKGDWWVPHRYVRPLGLNVFTKAVFVDRKNQNAVTLEYADTAWLVRSMVPVTTGVQKPPYMWRTPAGIFVVQGKIPKMFFNKDGSREPGGYAPYAARFSNGAYLHGVPVNYPDKNVIEYSATLGTFPRSHMCVRNVTSHAEFVYDWATVDGTLVFVFD